MAGSSTSGSRTTEGEEVGGIVPHVTLKSIANNEPPAEEVLVDRPEIEHEHHPRLRAVRRRGDDPAAGRGARKPVRCSGRGRTGTDGKFADRMLEVLRKSPVLRLEGNRTVTLKNIRPPAKIALAFRPRRSRRERRTKPVAFAFGPENGAVTETLVHQALREANMKGYAHLYVIGFAIQPNARKLIDDAGRDGRSGDLRAGHARPDDGRPAQEPAVEPDLQRLRPARGRSPHRPGRASIEVELLGLDVFDPVTMEVEHRRGDDVPAWFLDTDYNNLCFHVCQAFFPRTSAWDNLKKALKGIYDDSVWDHLAGTMSTPFEPGEHRQIAVKVIDDRGNELLVVRACRVSG